MTTLLKVAGGVFVTLLLIIGGFFTGKFIMSQYMNDIASPATVSDDNNSLLTPQSVTTIPTTSTKKEPVYVILESHNEDTWGPKVNRPEMYASYRENLVDKLNIIASYGATLDWQSDHTVLEAMIAMIEYETQPDLLAKTDGMNILQYIESLGFSVDPHVHTYNHADVVHLIEELGVKAGDVIGGVEVFDCGDPLYSFSDWQGILGLESDGTIHGVVYPDEVWTPKILSGAAFPGHWYGDYTSGVWRPGNADAFYINQPNGTIANIGSGYPYDELNIGWEHRSGSLVESKDAEYLKELIEKIQSGEAPSGQMYTSIFQIRDESTLTDGDEVIDVNENLNKLLDELKPYADSGQIVYVTYEEALQIWEDEYKSEPSQYTIDNFSIYDGIVANLESHCEAELSKSSRPKR